MQYEEVNGFYHHTAPNPNISITIHRAPRKLMSPPLAIRVRPHPPYSSSSSGGSPHGSNIFCVNSYFVRPTLSPFATAKYDAIA